MLPRKPLAVFAVCCSGAAAYSFWKGEYRSTSMSILCSDKKWSTCFSKLQTSGCARDTGSVTSSKSIASRMESLVKSAQTVFCREIERLEDGKKFTVDKFDRGHYNGYGISCVLQNGKVFERVAVLVNVSRGSLSEGMEKHMRANGRLFQRKEDGQLPYVTLGISSVAHPVNPHCPSLHYNYRYFEVTDATGAKTWWFGGGIDMTPSYLNEEDIRHFHNTIKQVCDKHDKSYYITFKEWCDKYHYIKIHDEHRGIGGIFFDDLESDHPEKIFSFVDSCVNSVIPCYIPIIEKNMNNKYNEAEKRWQQIRRGRYVEFNLLYDRGTKFGLTSPNARIENILAALPLTARWEYKDGHLPAIGTPEYEMLQVLKTPRAWVDDGLQNLDGLDGPVN